jgi:FkbM family methyltransferase
MGEFMIKVLQFFGFQLNLFLEKTKLSRIHFIDRIFVAMYYLYKKQGERHNLELLRQEMPRYSAFIDVGLGFGFYTSQLIRIFPKSCFIGFEPDELNFSRSKSQIPLAGNISLYRSAVSNKNGVINLERDLANPANHRVIDLHKSDTVEVGCVKLDDFLDNSQAYLIKIDVQGHELQVIQGSTKLISAGISGWFIEFDPKSHSFTFLDEIFQVFISKGYYAKALTGGAWKVISALPTQQDYFDLYFTKVA